MAECNSSSNELGTGSARTASIPTLTGLAIIVIAAFGAPHSYGVEFKIELTNPGGILTGSPNPFGPAGADDTIRVNNNTTTPALVLRITKTPPGSGGEIGSGSALTFMALDACETITVVPVGQRNALTMTIGEGCDPIAAIPTVSEWGLIFMGLLIFTAGSLLYGRWRRVGMAI